MPLYARSKPSERKGVSGEMSNLIAAVSLLVLSDRGYDVQDTSVQDAYDYLESWMNERRKLLER